MGKKNKHRHHSPSQPAPVAPSPSHQTDPTVEAANLQAEGLAAAPETPPPPPALESTPVNLNDALNQARHAHAAFTEAQQRLKTSEEYIDKREAEARRKSEAISKRTEELDQRERELRDGDKTLQTERSEFSKKKAEDEKIFVDREVSIAAREADAVAGFLALKRDMLAQVEAELNRQVEASIALEKSRLGHLTTYEERLTAMRAELLSGLEEERSQLVEKGKRLQQAQREADWAKSDADELKQSLEQRLAESLRSRHAEFDERMKTAHDHLADLARQLGEKEAAERASGGRSVPELLADIDRLRRERLKLQDELSRRASDEQTQRLSLLESDNETLRTDLAEARRKEQIAEQRLARQMIGVSQVEILKDQQKAWEVREAAYRTSIEQLKMDLGRLTDQASTQPAFSELAKLDTAPEFQRPPDSVSVGHYTNLKLVVQRARHAMAQGGQNTPPLYYTERAIRCFLGGLASNRLHVFQGISGTGKSSLPREFAKALGWESAFVEVQSSWRDKTDLLGYYNAFEKRFYESTCLQALYKAQCKAHAGRPYFIVLDEMNLAQTEHYFADFLSALEQTDPEKRRIGLVGHSLSPAPRLLIDGKTISIPDNVWFIGTANHDESTKDFADKTYDRAYVMELPRVHDTFVAKPTPPVPLDWPALKDLFEGAQRDQAKEANDALRFLETKLKQDLSDLDLGWGNRFEKQLRGFLPVVVASGGEPAEALDHLLATKVLRKLKGRFDLSAQSIERLRDSLERAWAITYPKEKPVDSLQLLASERRRLGGQGKE